VARQVVARRLGLPLEQVQVVVEMDDQLCSPSQALGPMGKKDIHERY
jgi:hypothetical protein